MKKIILSTIVIILLILTSTLNINAAPAEEESTKTTVKMAPKPCYGYIIPINPNDHFNTQIYISRLINELLQEEIIVYWLTTDISVKSRVLLKQVIKTNDFNKGSYIVPINGTADKDLKILSILTNYNNLIFCDVDPYEILEPIENILVYNLKEPNLAYHAGYSTIDSKILWYFYYNALAMGGFRNARLLEWDVIPDELNNEENEFDVLIWGGGNTDKDSVRQKLFDQFNPAAINAVRDFIDNGEDMSDPVMEVM